MGWILLLVGFSLAGCPGCSETDLEERDFFEPRDMHPYEFDGEPEIEGPDRLLFLGLEVGEEAFRQGVLTNIGRTSLELNDFVVDGPFELDFPEFLDGPPRMLSPGQSLVLEVGYRALDEEPRRGSLTVFSNDPKTPEFEIALLANVDLPCVIVEPFTRLRFGSVVRGERVERPVMVTNCSETLEATVEIEGFEGDSGFRLANANDLAGNPRTIQAGESVLIPVEFRPQEVRSYNGQMTILSEDEINPEVQLALEGEGTPPACPEAIIYGVSNNDTALAAPQASMQGRPLETVGFDGSQSVAFGGASIVEYQWSLVSRPDDTVVELSQSGNTVHNDLYLELSGSYEVELHVYDDEGTRSCEPARMRVDSVSGDAIHLQLVWDTPNDPSRTNNSGADMDLHFLREGGEWNSSPDDCYWLNMNPNWGDPNNNDMNPRLDIDEIHGWGPENINLLIPENGTTYSVGAYYFSDHGYGESFSTVRIYIHGDLRLELKRRRMTNWQFWHVADIDWPSEELTIYDSITSGFPN